MTRRYLLICRLRYSARCVWPPAGSRLASTDCLLLSVLIQAVLYGGRKEYDAVKDIQEKPKTPTSRRAAMYVYEMGSIAFWCLSCYRRAMCWTEDPKLLEETFEYILTKARDQDVIYFLNSLQANFSSRRKLAEFFEENYDQVSFAQCCSCVCLRHGFSSSTNALKVISRWDGSSRYDLFIIRSTLIKII